MASAIKQDSLTSLRIKILLWCINEGSSFQYFPFIRGGVIMRKLKLTQGDWRRIYFLFLALEIIMVAMVSVSSVYDWPWKFDSHWINIAVFIAVVNFIPAFVFPIGVLLSKCNIGEGLY